MPRRNLSPLLVLVTATALLAAPVMARASSSAPRAAMTRVKGGLRAMPQKARTTFSRLKSSTKRAPKAKAAAPAEVKLRLQQRSTHLANRIARLQEYKLAEQVFTAFGNTALVGMLAGFLFLPVGGGGFVAASLGIFGLGVALGGVVALVTKVNLGLSASSLERVNNELAVLELPSTP